jgi:hypothetical protein
VARYSGAEQWRIDLTRMFELEWVARRPRTRAERLTDAGRPGLGEQFGVALP